MPDENPPIHFPTAAENEAATVEFLTAMNAQYAEHTACIPPALDALARIIATFPQRTGQSFKLRALLYSLWNGQPADLSDTLCLDWQLRKDFCAVVMAFGYEAREIAPGVSDFSAMPCFFYKEVQDALTAAGQFDWFLECHASSFAENAKALI